MERKNVNVSQRRSLYYTDGSTARKAEYAPSYDRPVRRQVPQPNRVPKQQTKYRTRAQREQARRRREQAEKALAFDFRYTVFVVAAVAIMVVACVYMLYMESRINTQQSNINSMTSQLEKLENENTAYAISLNNMYTLDDIYDVASNELGMVYAKKGQIVYYESANEDYVKQYQDVPAVK